MNDCTTFSEEQNNALYQAIHEAADCVDYDDPRKVYLYLEATPRASLTVEIVDALHRMGYQITKM